ncbi:galactose-specific lectin nattectin-like [Thunnus albacares]|uniref:galactose-specific lectin nattectin-like n=1 Tax=Thunnus albacares TaxID=8236 RepID=UPI001CF707C2|nr:galactose-specific lectin nattectin-like [Thunnus albacares]XP_044206536.1 galactose-specific lectin nattectin-like [Thunnus albacares]
MALRFHLVCWISGLIVVTRSASTDFNVPVPGCPPDWTRLGSRCFIFRNTAKVFGDAESVCISLGGNLASIHSAEEKSFIRELINKGSGSYLRSWIGAHDGVKEGMWMWTDGSRFDYQDWHSGEPNNRRVENCAEINWQGEKWNDIACGHHRSFVCAKDL